MYHYMWCHILYHIYINLYTCDCFICAIFGVDAFVSFVSLGQWYLVETAQERFSLMIPKVSACHAVEMAGATQRLQFTSWWTGKHRKWQASWLHTTFTGLHNDPLLQLGSCSWQFYHSTTSGGMSVQDTVLWWTAWISTTGIVSVHCSSRRNKEPWEGLPRETWPGCLGQIVS